MGVAIGNIMARAIVAQSTKAVGNSAIDGEIPPERQICARVANHRSSPSMPKWNLHPAIRKARPIVPHSSRSGWLVKLRRSPIPFVEIAIYRGKYQSDMVEQVQVFDAIVAGGGPTGLVAASLLTQGGVRTALVSQASVEHDARTVALMQPAMRLLKNIGLWPEPFTGSAQPLRKLVLVDDTGDFFSAPPIVFAADELGLDAFGWNFPLESLRAALVRHAEAAGVLPVEGRIVDLDVTEDRAI